MSWEDAAPHRRLPTWAAALVVALLAAVAAAVVLSRRGGDEGRVAITPQPVGGVVTEEASQLRPQRVGQVATSRDVQGEGPLLPGAPPITIITADFNSRLQMVDVATGDLRNVTVLPQATATRPDMLQVVGDSIVLDTGRSVLRVADGARRPVEVARSHRSVPTAATDAVWVHDAAPVESARVASNIGFDGVVHQRVELPALGQPVGATADHLVVALPGTVVQVDADGSTREVARGQALASDGTRLARLVCNASLSCPVIIGTVDDPDQARVRIDRRQLVVGTFAEPQGRFSPDGRWLALPVARIVGGGDGRTEETRVLVIDTASGTVVARLASSSRTDLATPVAWAPDGRWLVVSNSSTLWAWSAATGDVTELDVRVSPSYAVAVR